MERAIQMIYQKHGQGYQHDYETDWQLLDVDMTGQPCGKRSEFASKCEAFEAFAKFPCEAGSPVGIVE